MGGWGELSLRITRHHLDGDNIGVWQLTFVRAEGDQKTKRIIDVFAYNHKYVVNAHGIFQQGSSLAKHC